MLRAMEPLFADSYRQRNPWNSDYYRCTQDHFEQLEMAWDDRYECRYGSWRRKINEVDFLTCPQCQGRMRVIAFIEDDAVIRKILVHLGLWDTRNHDSPHPAPESYQDCIIEVF